ncbi:class I SAM-dependent methyltransferase [Candidatus Binatus sp.]|uniref:class I SAM-dependent methyltransferase n=1 Tax=Candidatus Binatus sp. TaxID=2811406 RepID=UPI003CC64568
MISVLQDWRELGECIETLQRDRLPLHTTPQKNWDHFILRRALAGLEPSASIADLGCGHGLTLEFLRRQGFENLLGIDLSIGWRLRAREALTMYRERRFTRPYRILRGSISESSIAESSISLALSISTIEHGVDIDRFLADSFRILKPGARLFVTTDYWGDKIEVPDSIRAFGMPWRIFDKEQISRLLDSAARIGFEPNEDPIPDCSGAPVVWQGFAYTFIALLLRKPPSRSPHQGNGR